MTGLGVVGSVAADRQQRFVRVDLPEQTGQHRCVAYRLGRDLDRPDLQRLRVDTDVQLAPLAPVLCAVLLSLPFAFAHHLQAGAIDQQVQPCAAGRYGIRTLSVFWRRQTVL